MVQKIPNEMLEDVSPDLVGLVPVGAVVDFFGAVAPANWVFCAGQQLAKADYPALWAVLGSAFEVNSTTFALPDTRGRVLAGRDNMGGTPANRLTNAVSGVQGSVLGAAGGNQNLQAHGHSVVDPGHNHPAFGGASNVGADTTAMMLGVGYGGGTSIQTATTGVSIANAGTGDGQNVQPTMISNKIIRVR